MTNIQVFENKEFGQLRTIDIDDVRWFVGKDVATALGYKNTRKALSDHVEAEDKKDGVTIRDAIGREQNTVVINESGLYALIFSSKLPSAKRFKRWVTSEVLPAIRKTGSYSVNDQQPKQPAYRYFDKHYNGAQVMTTKDIEHFTGIKSYTIYRALMRRTTAGTDYALLTGSRLDVFKRENPEVPKNTRHEFIVYRSGFDQIAAIFGFSANGVYKALEEPRQEADTGIHKKLLRICKQEGITVQKGNHDNGCAIRVNGRNYIIINDQKSKLEKHMELAYGVAQHLFGGLDCHTEYTEYEARMFAVLCTALSVREGSCL